MIIMVYEGYPSIINELVTCFDILRCHIFILSLSIFYHFSCSCFHVLSFSFFILWYFGAFLIIGLHVDHLHFYHFMYFDCFNAFPKSLISPMSYLDKHAYFAFISHLFFKLNLLSILCHFKSPDVVLSSFEVVR